MDIQLPFDPLKRGAEIETAVMQGIKRLYYRMRPSRFYGGASTAEAVGCSLLCAYCWNYNRNLNPGRYHDYYSPHETASRLLFLAQKNQLGLFRLSGAEPVLGHRSFHHLLEVIKILSRYRPGSPVIVDTNGIFLGYQPQLLDHFHRLNVKVRIGLKGIDPESYETISGAGKEFYHFPLKTLRELKRRNIGAWPALISDFFSPQSLKNFEDYLAAEVTSSPLELEPLKQLPMVTRNIARRRKYNPNVFLE
jgi:uncharacterized Fe-S cluster-containing radical SAM superfamily protein